MIAAKEYEQLLHSFLRLQQVKESQQTSCWGTWSLDATASPPMLRRDDPIRLFKHPTGVPMEETHATVQDEDSETAEFELHTTATTTAATVTSETTNDFLFVRLHICYDIVYRVPLFCIEANDGATGSPVSLVVLYGYLPTTVATKDPVDAFVTQVEHPFTEVPTFVVHPCRTAGIMSVLLNESLPTPPKADPSYLLVWLHLHLNALGSTDVHVSVKRYKELLVLVAATSSEETLLERKNKN